MKNMNLKFVSFSIFSLTLVLGTFMSNTNTIFAADATLSSQNFIVWNQGNIKGYDVGFSIKDDTFNNASSIVIKLYSGDTLLQTNTALSGKIIGTEFVTPFDVFGTFNYESDGYFTNVKESEYGKALIPTKVTATVTMNDGKTLTVSNSSLSGDTKSITGNSMVLGASKYNFTQKLKVGSKGNEVTELQKYLNANGYDCGKVDGGFGTKTKTAVAKLQVANKLKGDGLVGPVTRAILNK